MFSYYYTRVGAKIIVKELYFEMFYYIHEYDRIFSYT